MININNILSISNAIYNFGGKKDSLEKLQNDKLTTLSIYNNKKTEV